MKNHYWTIASKHERHGKMVMHKRGDSPVDSLDGHPVSRARDRNAFLYYHNGLGFRQRRDHEFFLAYERNVPWEKRYFFTFDTDYQLLRLVAEDMLKRAKGAELDVMKQEELDKQLDHEELLWTLAWIYLHRLFLQGKPPPFDPGGFSMPSVTRLEIEPDP